MTSVLYILLGIVVLVIPDTMIKTMGYLVGALLIIAGAVSMICYLLRDTYQNYYRNDFVYGLVGIAVGIIVLYKVEWIISLVPVILGVLVVASGCRKLQDVIDMKRMEYGNWVLMLVLAAVNVIFGAVLVINPFEAAVLLFQLIGVGLVLSGLTDCAITLYFAGKIKNYMADLNAVDSTFVEHVEKEEGRPAAPESKKSGANEKEQAASGEERAEARTEEKKAEDGSVHQPQSFESIFGDGGSDGGSDGDKAEREGDKL